MKLKLLLHTNILLIRFMCENNARWYNKIYTFSAEEITELYPFLKHKKVYLFSLYLGTVEF